MTASYHRTSQLSSWSTDLRRTTRVRHDEERACGVRLERQRDRAPRHCLHPLVRCYSICRCDPVLLAPISRVLFGRSSTQARPAATTRTEASEVSNQNQKPTPVANQ
jgi:hypothetical protein